MNTLRLKWRQGFVGWAVDCPLCGATEETVAHFVTECVVLEGAREQFGVTRDEVLEEMCSSEGGHMRRWREASHCWRRCGEGEEEKWTDKCRDGGPPHL